VFLSFCLSLSLSSLVLQDVYAKAEAPPTGFALVEASVLDPVISPHREDLPDESRFSARFSLYPTAGLVGLENSATDQGLDRVFVLVSRFEITDDAGLVRSIELEQTIEGLSNAKEPFEVSVNALWDGLAAPGIYDVSLSCALIRRTTIEIPKKAPKLIERELARVECSVGTVQLLPEPPRFEISSPANESWTNETSIILEGTVVSQVSVIVWVNGSEVLVVDGAFSVSVFLSGEGSNVITVRAEDEFNQLDEESLTVYRDTEAPLIIVDSPQDGAQVQVPEVLVSGHIEDASPELTLTIQGDAVVLSNGSFSHLLSLNPGLNEVSLLARDLAGNESQSSLTVNYITGRPPEVEITSPIDGFITSEGQISVAGTATDPDDDLLSVIVNGELASLSDGLFTAEIALSEGENTLVAVAKDSQGRESESSPVIIFLDTLAPTISFITFYGATVTEPTPCLRVLYADEGTGVDLTSGRIYLDDVDITTLCLIGSNEAAYKVQTALTEGEHVLRASVSDLGGFKTDRLTLFRYVDGPPQLRNLRALREFFCPAPNPYDEPENAQIGIAFDLSEAATVTLRAVGEQGVVVSTRSFSSLAEGENEIFWDGRTDDERLLKPAHYRLEVQATDASGHASVVSTVYVRVIF